MLIMEKTYFCNNEIMVRKIGYSYGIMVRKIGYSYEIMVRKIGYSYGSHLLW